MFNFYNLNNVGFSFVQKIVTLQYKISTFANE